MRRGSCFPSFPEPPSGAERVLSAVIETAYVKRATTRKVEGLMQASGLSGSDKSKVSRICKELDEAVAAFRHRALQAEYPYQWLDA